MKWAMAQGYRVDNPAGEAIRAALQRPGHVQKHLKALPYDEVAGAIEAIRRSGAGASVKLGLEFLALTACRSGEVRGASWGEIDAAGGVWTIPPERMKGRVGTGCRCRAGGGRFSPRRKRTHPGRSWCSRPRGGCRLRALRFSDLFRELGIGAVPHGFRSSFRDWAAERTDAPHAVMEAALAHVVRNQVEAAYARSDLFERRRVLMEQWAEYLASRRADTEG